MPTNPGPGNFTGLDPDYDLGPIRVQWSDLGAGLAAKVGVIWESRQYVWDGVSAWVRMTQPGGGGGPAAIVSQGTRDATAQAWYVTFNGVTQPVSISAAVDISDRAARLLGHVTVDNVSIAVTGTFWQATQPVSGTFWQATQPVSLAAAVDISDRAARLLGHVTVDNASLAVTGTFWQATQPVSLASAIDISDRAARLLGHVTVDNASLAVTGTFWQATQPVSIAAAVDVSDRAARLLGVVYGTGGQVNQQAKGTQGANALTTQDYKDSGRNMTNYFMAAPIVTTAAEAMQLLTGYKGGIAVAATVSPVVVTAGKIYRITQITLTYFNVAALGSARFNLRANLTGLGVVGSPLVWTKQIGLSGDGASTAGHVSTYIWSHPDGMEFAAGTGIALGVIGETAAAPNTAGIVGFAHAVIEGFEY